MAQIDAGLAEVSKYRLKEQAGDPANPAAGYGYLYCKDEGIYFKQDDGTVIGPLGVPYTAGARVYNNANISINDSAATSLTFNSETFDTDDIHDLGVNPERLTCKTAGTYFIYGLVRWAADADGSRIAAILLNAGALDIGSNRDNVMTAGDEFRQIAIATYELAVNDYVELIVFHNAGNALNVLYQDASSPVFGMHRIG